MWWLWLEVVQDLDRIWRKTREERTLCFQADGAACHKYCDEDNEPGGSGPVKWHSDGDFNNPDAGELHRLTSHDC